MEIYHFYDGFRQSFVLLEKDSLQSQIVALGLGFLAWAALFVLQGIGLFVMAKKRNIKGKWMAFVPFLSVVLIGRLTGECDMFGQKVKRAGLYAMLAQIAVTLISFASIAASIYLYAVEGVPARDKYLEPIWSDLNGFSATAYEFVASYGIGRFLASIVELIYEILMLILIMGLYKKYAPKNYIMLGVLSLFVPLSRYIAVLVLRKRTAVDYEEYMRRQREEFMRRRQQYYNSQNPYGNGQYGNNPYGNNPYGNPYGNPYNNTQRPPYSEPQPEDPFAEFSSGKKQEEPFTEYGEKNRDRNENNNGRSSHNSDGFFD
ncbi:MAG: hypothetical protein IKD47_04275 [Clostridia bacterium]|nr:hypothetical protein [Clostridia bacterium]